MVYGRFRSTLDQQNTLNRRTALGRRVGPIPCVAIPAFVPLGGPRRPQSLRFHSSASIHSEVSFFGNVRPLATRGRRRRPPRRHTRGLSRGHARTPCGRRRPAAYYRPSQRRRPKGNDGSAIRRRLLAQSAEGRFDRPKRRVLGDSASRSLRLRASARMAEKESRRIDLCRAHPGRHEQDQKPVPAAILEQADENTLRETFDRIDSRGKRINPAEVFDAVHEGPGRGFTERSAGHGKARRAGQGVQLCSTVRQSRQTDNRTGERLHRFSWPHNVPRELGRRSSPFRIRQKALDPQRIALSPPSAARNSSRTRVQKPIFARFFSTNRCRAPPKESPRGLPQAEIRGSSALPQ